MGRLLAVCLLAAWAAPVLAAGCADLDTSWHEHKGELNPKDFAAGKVAPGIDAWRYVRHAAAGETFPGGATARAGDVVWEWRMELANISGRAFEVKVKFFLVTADRVELAGSQYPPEEEKMAVLAPGEKKFFTGQGLVDKKYIPRVARGRGKFGIRPFEHGHSGSGKETGR